MADKLLPEQHAAEALATFARKLEQYKGRGWNPGRSQELIRVCRDGTMLRWKHEVPSALIRVDADKGILFHVGGLHAHLPYHAIPEDALESFRGLLPDDFLLLSSKIRASAADTGEIAENLACELTEAGIADETGSAAERIADAFRHAPIACAAALADRVPISAAMLGSIASGLDEPRAARFATDLLRVAEYTANTLALRKKPGTDFADTATAFDATEKILNDPSYTPVAEIARGIFSPPLAERLAGQGILSARASFRGGAEGIVVFGAHSLGRIFLKPDRHATDIRPTLDAIPAVTHTQFTQVDRFCRTRQEFIRHAHDLVELIRTSGDGTSGSTREIREMAHRLGDIIATEIPDRFPDFQDALFPVLKNAANSLPLQPVLEQLEHALVSINDDYASIFDTTDLTTFLQRSDPTLERIDEAVIGPEYLDGAGVPIRDAKDTNGNPSHHDPAITELLKKRRVAIKVVHAKEERIPRAKLRTALNALGIKPGPTIRIETGSAFLTDEMEKSITRKAVRALVRFADSRRCNLGISDTQSGGGGIVGEEILLAQREAGEAGREFGARPYTVSPGKEVFTPGFTKDGMYEEVQKDGSIARKVRYAGSVVSTLVTNLIAGWTSREEKSPYEAQSKLERIVDMIAGRGDNTTVVLNGGPGVIRKINEDIRHGSRIIIVRETGRFADIAAAILTSGAESWHDLSDDAVLERIRREVVPGLPPYTVTQAGKDVGENNPAGSAEIVRFVRSIDSATIALTTAEGLSATLEQMSAVRL